MIPGSLGVIPARLSSSRLPRKPLHLIAGRPLIEWVWRRAHALGVVEMLVVATDSEEIAAVVEGFGGCAEMTSPSHPSGTDRVAEVAEREAYKRYPLILNIQGDEPFLDGEHLEVALRLVAEEGWDIGTIASTIETVDEWADPSVVKVARDDRGGALYFSRSPIPYARNADAGFPPQPELRLRHVGLYAYTRSALLGWVELPVGPLEATEKLEQLRPLSAGFRIGVARVNAPDGGIDTLHDAERAERKLNAQSVR